jgi:hypothetical protein
MDSNLRTDRTRIDVMFAFLLVLLLPAVGRQQLFTGTLVNAALLLATTVCDRRHLLLICLAPSLAALTSGLLPWPLAPLVPILCLGNLLYVWVFMRLQPWTVLGAAAMAVTAKVGVLALFNQPEMASLLGVPLSALAMLGWPQMATAALGAGLALAVLEWGRRT